MKKVISDWIIGELAKAIEEKKVLLLSQNDPKVLESFIKNELLGEIGTNAGFHFDEKFAINSSDITEIVEHFRKQILTTVSIS